MKISADFIDGLGLHYYTNNSNIASDFDEQGWFDVFQKTLRMEERIVNNDGRHAAVEFFQSGGGMVLDASIEGSGLEKQIIPASMLFHE